MLAVSYRWAPVKDHEAFPVWEMFLPPLGFALVQLRITQFPCARDVEGGAGRGHLDDCVVQHFDVSVFTWELPKQVKLLESLSLA